MLYSCDMLHYSAATWREESLRERNGAIPTTQQTIEAFFTYSCSLIEDVAYRDCVTRWILFWRTITLNKYFMIVRWLFSKFLNSLHLWYLMRAQEKIYQCQRGKPVQELKMCKDFHRSKQNQYTYFSLRLGILEILKNQRRMDIKYWFKFTAFKNIHIVTLPL
jgi:hypothetical protein